MKTKKIIAMLLVCILALSLAATALAESPVLYVNLGDSVAWGRIEDEGSFPDYDWEEDSYSGIFAKYLNTERTSYARRGMQTTDILYMIDTEFRTDVDAGIITPDSWWKNEYPPYDGVTLDEVNNNIANADYISLCIGICDYISYPGDVHTAALEKLEDPADAKELLNKYLAEGKIDFETAAVLSTLINIYFEEAKTTLQYVFDILEGYHDYLRYYPRIVADLRNANEDGVIMLIGNYLPGDTFGFLEETDESGQLVFFVNRLLDNINLVAKEAAEKYNCLYVDTMGVDSAWHPTVNGHRQIADRMISVLNGEAAYAGNITLTTSLANRIIAALKEKITAFLMLNPKIKQTISIITKSIVRIFG